MKTATAPHNNLDFAATSDAENAADDDYRISFADVTVNLDKATVTRGGKTIALTVAEFELLTLFLQNPEKPLTRDAILDSVWSYLGSPNTRTVDAHVMRLRHKLEKDPEAPRHFLTVHKVGYRFCPEEKK